MQNRTKSIFIAMIAAATLAFGMRCKQPYVYPVSAQITNFLHIEGVINTTGDTTTINLSRTVKLTDTIKSKPELNATVTVEDTKGDVFTLIEGTAGNYTYPNFSFLSVIDKQWRINIATTDGKTYQSDFVPIKNSPPIDSLYYREDANGVWLYSDTHDPSNNTRYYRWDYDETWVVYSVFDSYFKVQTSPVNAIVERSLEDQIDSCWINGRSSTLILNSSAKLSRDFVQINPVAFISKSSEKLRGAYSILLHQHALTKEAFEYWQNLKKNTEQLGSIFDAQPSQIQGNIHCVNNPAEPVLGFLSAGADSRKRIIVRRISLPGFPPYRPPNECRLDTLKIADLNRIFTTTAVPVEALYNTRHELIGYTVSVAGPCVDCTVRGTNVKPDFWR